MIYKKKDHDLNLLRELDNIKKEKIHKTKENDKIYPKNYCMMMKLYYLK